MPLLKNKLGAIYVPFLFNPDLILGGLLSVDATFITVDSDVFRADNHYNLTRGPQLVLNGDFSQEGNELVTSGGFSNGLTDWTAYGVTSVSSGVVTIGASANSGIFQGILTQGKKYKVTINVTSYDGVGNAQVINDYGTVLHTITTTGLQTFYFEHSISNVNIIIRATQNGVLSVSSFSVVEVGQNWTFNNSGGSNGWQIYDGRAICDGNATVSNRNLNSSATLTAGKTYRLNLDILQSEDNMQIIVGSTTLSQTLPTGTNINYEYIIDGSEHNGGVFALYAGSSDLQEVDNISIAEDTTYGPELVSNGNFSQIGIEQVSNGNFSQEGSELVTNGDFATDTGWNKQSGWVITNGYAESTALSTRSVYQNIGNAVVGKTYKITYTILETNGGNFKFVYGGVNGTIRNTTGTYIEYFKATSSADGTLYFDALNVFIGKIDNVSVKEVGQNWTLGTGASIGDGKVVTDGSGGNYDNIIYQDTNVSFANKNFKIKFDVLDYVSGKMRVSAGNSAVTPHVEANGSYEFISNVGVGNDILYFINYQVPFVGSITNISVEEVGQYWNFVGDFETDGTKAFINNASQYSQLTNQLGVNYLLSGRKYRLSLDIPTLSISGAFAYRYTGGPIIPIASSDIQDGKFTTEFTMPSDGYFWLQTTGSYTGLNVEVDNISVVEDRSLNIL